MIEYASDKLLNDRSFMLEAIDIDAKFLEYASDELKDDR